MLHNIHWSGNPVLIVGHRYCPDMFPAVDLLTIANTNLVGHWQIWPRQMPKLVRKCPVTSCYYEHWYPHYNMLIRYFYPRYPHKGVPHWVLGTSRSHWMHPPYDNVSGQVSCKLAVWIANKEHIQDRVAKLLSGIRHKHLLMGACQRSGGLGGCWWAYSLRLPSVVMLLAC